MPGSRLEVFDGAGHFPHLDEPLRFSRLMRTFVARRRSPPESGLRDARELMLARAA